jgi:hypothetical protein
VRTVTRGDATAAVVDALADLYHVHDGDELALGEDLHECLKAARHHYANEPDVLRIEDES